MHIVVDSDSDSDFDDTLNARRKLLAELSQDANLSFGATSIEKVGNLLDELVLAPEPVQRRYEDHLAEIAHVEQLRDDVNSQSMKMCSRVDESQQSREQKRLQRLQEIRQARERAEEIAREKERIAAELERQKREKERLELQKQEEARKAEQRRLEEQAAKLKAERDRQEAEKAAQEAEKKRLEAEKDAKAKAESEAKAAAEKAKEKAEQEAKEAAETQAKEAAQKAAQQASQAQGFTDMAEVNKEFAHYKELIASYKRDLVAPVSAQPALKAGCFAYKTKIKTKLGQLTYTKEKVVRTRAELRTLFGEAKNQGDLVYRWTLNCYAKAMVSHAESQAHLAVQTAVPLAMVTILLWSDYPELGEYVIARLVKKCPQVIGYGCSIETEEGRIRMGYKREDERWETQEAYSERISAMTAVFAALTQTKLGVKENIKHPFPIKHSWLFVARQLNKPTELLLNADYAAVASWWDICCERFQLAFGKQANKVLDLAANGWTAASAQHKYPAAARLRLLGEDWKSSGKLQQAWKPLA